MLSKGYEGYAEGDRGRPQGKIKIMNIKKSTEMKNLKEKNGFQLHFYGEY